MLSVSWVHDCEAEMTGKNRYWDHERCAWIAYEAAAATSTAGGTPELASESLPEQRADKEAAPAPADTSLPVVTS
jgi:hypothetical protein